MTESETKMNTKKSYEKYRAEFRVKKTKNGYDFSKLLSALQKYIRRSECEKAIKCAIEADTFLELEIANEEVFELFKKETNTYQDKLLTDLHKIVKGIRTNFINRLIVIMSEEVNINDRIDIPIIEPVIQKRVTGLLPYLSLISPINGEAVN